MNDRDAIGSNAPSEGAQPVVAQLPYNHPQGRLRERIKELRCLYDVLALTSNKEADVEIACAQVIQVLMRSFLHEDRTVVRIRLNDCDVCSGNWLPPDPAIEEPIRCEGMEVGMLCVGYAGGRAAQCDFEPEERELAAAVAAHLSKMAEDRLLLDRIREAERTKTIGQMTSGLAHDFNNLLTVIIGSAETLRDNFPPDDANHGHARLIGEAADRGSTITAQLLAYSRRQPLSPRTVASGPLLWELEGLLLHTLGVAIRCEIDVPDDAWPMLVDRAQMENALLNLASNSRDAMPGGGLFRIAITNLRVMANEPGGDGIAAGEYVRLEVSDTGCGMTDEVAAHAFDPFFTTKEGRGSGLGLSSVMGFVRQSHGRIGLISAAGRGTTFSMLLPRSKEAAAATGSAGSRASPEGAGERILLVEDEELVRRLAASVLAKLGYAVTPAATVEEAQAAMAGKADFELLFSDVMLTGGGNGIELAKAARKLNPAIGILLTSGFSEDATAQADFPFTFISKPYRRADIAEKVAQALRQRGAE